METIKQNKMARLFIFAIGGTGSRVLKSLTMLLASGVKPNSEKSFEIVPIIIDPHKSNQDLQRTQRILSNYQSITNKINQNCGFFGTKITTLDNLVLAPQHSNPFTFGLQNGEEKFKNYISYNQLDQTNKALVDVLFSGESINKKHQKVNLLDVEMDIGFVGNPNIGSVVLNQFKDSKEFKDFASIFNIDDRVFIISSIFGGTGAAGFPTVLKNIRNAMNNGNINGKGYLQDAKIGALTVLPYFNIEVDEGSPIQKSHFIAKTKAALHYYRENVTGNNSINTLYYIADDHGGRPYKNDPGDKGQKNNAHFIELASALSIIDFLEIPDNELETIGGKALKPIYKEFGMRNDSENVKFDDFGDISKRKLELKLSQLVLFRKYVDEHLSKALEKEAWSTDYPQIDMNFLDDVFYRTYVIGFLNDFGEWLEEMRDNTRAFSPFNLDSSLESLIDGRTVKKGLWPISSSVNFSLFNDRLSKNSRGKTYISAQEKFIKLFFETTQEILKTKFGLNY